MSRVAEFIATRMADFRSLKVRHVNTMIHNIIVYQSLAIKF